MWATSGVSSIAFSYSYNKNGYITGEKRTEGGKTTESAYIYDPLGQLTGFTKSTGYAEQYAYDKAGNMLQKVITGEAGRSVSTSSDITPAAPVAVTLKMQYNKANQLISMANGQDTMMTIQIQYLIIQMIGWWTDLESLKNRIWKQFNLVFKPIDILG